jgi:Bacterial Ig domain
VKHPRRICSILTILGLAALPAAAQTNHAPVANAQSFTIDEDHDLEETLSASDPDGDYLAFYLVDLPAHGWVSYISNTGAFSYTPYPDYHGSDSFTYKVNDGTLDSSPATVSVTINSVNDAPVATGALFTIDEDNPLYGTLTATDVDGDSLSFRLTTQPNHGIALAASGGAFSYFPNKDFFGQDSFGFVANDGHVDSDEAKIVVTVNPINDAPVANPIALALPPGRTMIGQLQGFDVDGDALFYTKISEPIHGTVAVDAKSGRFVYTPAGDVNNVTDSFGYVVSDGRLTSPAATVSIKIGNDAVGFIADTLHPQVTSVDFPDGLGSPKLAPTPFPGTVAMDQAVDRGNRRLYVLTLDGLNVYEIEPAGNPVSMAYQFLDHVPFTGGTHLALSLDGRTAYIGGTGKVTAVNLYPEGVYKESENNESSTGESVIYGAHTYQREFLFPEGLKSRGVAAMGVQPAGDRLFVVIDMDPAAKKLNINNNLLRSDVGNGISGDNLQASGVLPADFGFLTHLDISAATQTAGVARDKPAFATPINIRSMSLFPSFVAIGIKSIAFSPDGNCAFLAAVGAQTPRATPFGIMPTSDDSTGGILVVDARPLEFTYPPTMYLGFIPTTEKGENTAALRLQIQQQGWKIVHPEVQWARDLYSSALGQSVGAVAETALDSLNGLTAATDVLGMLETSYQEYGYMQAYFNLYPRDMVGASSVAINHTGDFGVVTMQDTNNLGLLSVNCSPALGGYSMQNRPDFFIARGTGKSVNGFDAALDTFNPGYQPTQWAYSWAYPQEVAFTSDDSRIYIGMAGGTPKADGTNRFGSADALVLRTERDRPNGVFTGGNPPPGYGLFSGGGVASLESPRIAATLQAFDSSHDLLSDQLKAYNRWNSLKTINPDWVPKLVSTDVARLVVPGQPLAMDSHIPDSLSFGFFIPPSGVGYRLNTYGMPIDRTNFATRGVVTAPNRWALNGTSGTMSTRGNFPRILRSRGRILSSAC